MDALGWSMDSAWGFLSGFSLRGGFEPQFVELICLGIGDGVQSLRYENGFNALNSERIYELRRALVDFRTPIYIFLFELPTCSSPFCFT